MIVTFAHLVAQAADYDSRDSSFSSLVWIIIAIGVVTILVALYNLYTRGY